MGKIIKKVKFLYALIFLGTILSCASKLHLNTPSGKPEIFIKNTQKKEIKNVIIDKMLSYGFILKRESENILVFYKFDENTERAVVIQSLLGSSSLELPEFRYIFNFIDYNNGIKIVVNVFYVVDSEVIDLSKNSKPAFQVQEFLLSLKKQFESNY